MNGIDVFGMTHPGKVRRNNEDQFFIASLHKSMRVRQTSLQDLGVLGKHGDSSTLLIVVADGVGGAEGGELASGTAVETVAAHIVETVNCCYTRDVDEEHEFLAQLEDAVDRAHQQVLRRHASEDRHPATTLTMVALIWPRAYVVHVGDSRAYYLRGGRLRQLTRDQTAFEELVDRGVLSDSQAQDPAVGHRWKNVLTSAVGTDFEPSIGLVDLQPGDVLLLCTDGLTKHVPDDDIVAIVGAGGSAEESCKRLVNLTLERGASDNVTVIVGRVAAT
jgi:serine/threonine protein phosphatase PrpC